MFSRAILNNVASSITGDGEGVGATICISGKVPGRHPLRIIVATIRNKNIINLIIAFKIPPYTKDEKPL
jgi:hypothetical protein